MEASYGCLGTSGALLRYWVYPGVSSGRLLASWERLRRVLKPFADVLEASCGRLECLEPSWRRLGGVLGRLGVVFKASVA